MAKAIMYSGSYMLFANHSAAPSAQVFADIKYETPNYSGRMDNLRAAILREQLKDLDQQCERWNKRYDVLQNVLKSSANIRLTQRPAKEQYVASTIQFSLPSFNSTQVKQVVADAAARGVVLKWFGADTPDGYTSRYDSWRYLDDMPKLTTTEQYLSVLLDMRIPLTFSVDDCQLIAEIIADVVAKIPNT